MVPQVRTYVWGGNIQGQGKVRKFYFESRKINSLKKSRGNLSLWSQRCFCLMKKANCHCQGKLHKNFGCKGRLDLLYLTFCIYLVWEILLLSGKSRGILKTDVCGNHAITDLQIGVRVRLFKPTCIAHPQDHHVSLQSRYQNLHFYWSVTGKSEGSGNNIVLKVDSRTRSRTRTPIWRSVILWRRHR